MTLHTKWLKFLLSDIFNRFFSRCAKVLMQNCNFILVKTYNHQSRRLFYLIKEWYLKIGANAKSLNERLLYLHYSLVYNNLTSLALLHLKKNLELNPYIQKQIMSAFYNLMLAYLEIQRTLFGLRLVFNGAIGQHGRSKTVTFFYGRLNNFLLTMPVEYTAINIDAIFGTIGARWWLGYMNFDTLMPIHVQAIGSRR
jgi:hypothetical protein